MSNYPDQDVERLSAAFRALGSPHRLRIFLRLASCCASDHDGARIDTGTCVGDIGADLALAPSTVSHHLKELRTAGLIGAERCGQSVACRVDPETLRELAEVFLKAGSCGAGRDNTESGVCHDREHC